MGDKCFGTVKSESMKSRVNQQCCKSGNDVCEDCGKTYCHQHMNRDKHNCDDSVEGCHSIWKKR